MLLGTTAGEALKHPVAPSSPMRMHVTRLGQDVLRACFTPPGSNRSLAKAAALQVTATPYAGLWDCCRSIMRREGLGTFFKSYQTTVGPSAVSWGLSC